MTSRRARLADALASGLAASRAEGLMRTRRVLDGPQGLRPMPTFERDELARYFDSTD